MILTVCLQKYIEERVDNMLKRKRFLISIILIVLFITGCVDGTDSKNAAGQGEKKVLQDTELFDEFGGAGNLQSTSIGYANNDSLVFTSDTNTINTTLNISATYKREDMNYKLDIGYMVFVDGLLQPVSVDGGEAKNMNIITVEKNAEHDVSFDMISGDKGKTVRIDTVSLLHPTYSVTEKTNSFGLCFTVTSPLPYSAECKNTVIAEKGSEKYEEVGLSEEIKENYILKDDEGNIINHLKSEGMKCDYYQNGKKADKIIIEDGKLSADIDFYGGRYEKYNIYLLLNNEVIDCFEGKSYVTMPVTAENVTRVHIYANIKNIDFGKYTQLFCMAVPVGELKTSDVYISKLENKVVINNDSHKN